MRRATLFALLLAAPAWAQTGRTTVAPPPAIEGGGSSVVLDLADDGTNESTGLLEVAITGDTNAIFTEPTADKLLINVGQAWPQCDAASTVPEAAVTAHEAALSILWAQLSGVPASFNPSAHGSTHAAAGADPVTITEAQISDLHTPTVDTDTTCLDAGVACLFAGSPSEGGPAADLACTGCVVPSEIASGTQGGSNILWDVGGASLLNISGAAGDHGIEVGPTRVYAWSPVGSLTLDATVAMFEGTAATAEGLQHGTAFPMGPATGDVFAVTDDSAVGACDSAAGSATTLCRWDGAAWVALGDGGGGGANPAGSGSELQFRSDATTFGAVPGSSVVGSTVGFVGNVFIDGLLWGGSVSTPRVMLQATASATVPVFVTRSNVMTSGVGGTSPTVALIVGSASKLTADASAITTHVAQVNTPSTQTCADDAAGTTPSLTVTVSGVTNVRIVVADPHGCDLVISETNASDGQLLELELTSSAGGVVTLPDTPGTQNLEAAWTPTAGQSITLRYNTTAAEWRERDRGDI